MILWDANLWVHAFRSDSPLHEAARAELHCGEASLFSPHMAASFLRLVTDPRIFEAAGNEVPGALLASIAIRHDAALGTADRGFQPFEGLCCRFID